MLTSIEFILNLTIAEKLNGIIELHLLFALKPKSKIEAVKKEKG